MADIWTDALEGLQPRLGSETFDLWLRPMTVTAIDDHGVRLRAPNAFMKEWFENHYQEVVAQEIYSRTSRRVSISVDVAPVPVVEEHAEVDEGDHDDVDGADGAEEDDDIALLPPQPPPQGLAERYRFSSFIKGASNELAASAAMAVAEEPGRRFNPLLLYGGVGLGKTHLLHAVGHAMHEQMPHMRIMYLTAERFMNEFISAVRYNKFDEFRRRYREDCDALLIDDIQFIAGRDRTMDEFFHVFNALHEAGKQIMVTSDRTPSDMQGMEERIISRLNWGLVADVKAPDLETRVAILRQKAELERIAIPNDVAVYLASLVRSNVRELEGALIRVSTFASLRGVPITREFVKEVIGDSAPEESKGPQCSVDSILKTVAAHFSVRIADLKGQRRHKGIARPRMIAMYLSRELTDASFPEIGHKFGGKDHSTVINACKRISSMQSEDADMRVLIQSLRGQILHGESA